MTRKISTFRSLMLLVDQDESDHVLKDIALLFESALRDWPTDNSRDIVKCIQEFKGYFGDPFTFVDGRIINIVEAPDWSWRGESGAALTEMIELSIKHYGTADFDAIVGRVLSHYEQKFLLTSKQKPISSTGFAGFDLCSSTLTKADYVQWLGLEPDEFGGTDNTEFDGTKTTIWSIRTPMTLNTVSANLIRRIVNRLVPIKDRLIALKQAHPDLNAELEVVLWSNPLDLYIDMDNETLLFLAEIGAQFRSEMFTI
ncbi:DUF4279 domain-containing protein [Haliscomenobacter hydrossis]|uniref:Uncharacterized protein n=1 Tax=Haliscomenobacter hydrossis (strain ATCC 27775 / DSM 1100 / LMG 10767 / O) TaxID=760192 RepID=F4L1A2_HALH1|nr:DUF4279 domain-containing protein [Haliscomenobacter hydrossis]AEE52834.1 hypothetical protein Halhy_5006 [Haliscomenobacter hydrossis DSM 1100]